MHCATAWSVSPDGRSWPWAQAEAVRGAILEAGRATDSAGRRADLSNELPRVRVDSFTASRGIHRRQLWPTVVDVEEL